VCPGLSRGPLPGLAMLVRSAYALGAGDLLLSWAGLVGTTWTTGGSGRTPPRVRADRRNPWSGCCRWRGTVAVRCAGRWQDDAAGCDGRCGFRGAGPGAARTWGGVRGALGCCWRPPPAGACELADEPPYVWTRQERPELRQMAHGVSSAPCSTASLRAYPRPAASYGAAGRTGGDIPDNLRMRGTR